MSLCILLRTPDGGALMAADSAVSTVYEGVPYRVQNEEDHEKVIVHLGHMIFCSGNLERCRVLRQYIRSLKEMDYEAISQFAQKLWGGQQGDDSTGILICAPDNSLVGMLSYRQFEVKKLSWSKDGLDIDTLGFHMQEAYQAACSAVNESKDWTAPVLAAFNATACEEVGGVLHIFSRTEPNGKITELKLPGPQPKNMRAGVFVPLTQTAYVMHAIVQANQFLDKNGKDMFTGEGKIAGEYIDARGITIKDAEGNDVVYFDETGIHWNKDYSPIKYQFSTSMNGPWHDTYATNDEYRRESFDGGTTWEAPYKLVGKDGQPGRDGADGSDATVPKYITDTVIAKGVIEAPQINANDFGIYPSSPSDYSGSFNIFGQHLSGQHHMFQIAYQGQKGVSTPPRIEMYSPESAEFYIAGGAGSGSGTLYLGKTAGYDPTYQNVMLCGNIDLSEGRITDWGNNHPVAVFG